MLLTLFCLPAALIQARDEKPVSHNVTKEKFHIYLLIGQSNMSGRAKYTKEQAEIIERCYLLNGNDEWEPAKVPLNRYSSIRKKSFQGMNAGYTFAKRMLEQDKKISLGLVVNARGGTKIEQWEKGTEYYNEAIERLKKAEKTGTLKGILWHQGEANQGNPEPYLEELKLLIESFRKDLAKPDLPFIAGQLCGNSKINDQIAKLPEVVPFTGYASSEGLTNDVEHRHIDNRSMLLFGQRYAEEMLKVQEKSAAE